MASTCVDGQEYTQFLGLVNQTQAIAFCIEENLELAVVKTALQFQFIISNFDRNELWIGIEGDQEPPNGIDIQSFTNLDGTPMLNKFKKLGQFPWAAGRPDNFGELNQNCVRRTEEGINDSPCSDLLDTLCSSPCFVEREKDDIFYHFFRQALPQTEAKKNCKRVGGSLALIKNRDEFNLARDQALLFKRRGSLNAWIGLEGNQPPNEVKIESFRHIDGDNNKDFFIEPFVFPWADIQPNNSPGLQNCVL